MTLRKYLLLVGINIAISWVIIALIIFRINPLQTTIWIYFFLYICIFIATGGTFFMLNFLARLKLKHDVIALRELRVALREGFLFGGLISLSLIMSRYGFLEWWNFGILLVAFILIEIFFLQKYN